MNVPRWQLKFQARQTLATYRKPFLVVGGTLLGLLTVTFFLQSFLGGVVPLLQLDLRTFPMRTGVSVANGELMNQLFTMVGLTGSRSNGGGLVLALRADWQQAVMVLLLPWSIFILQLAALLLTAPFHMGTLEQLRHMISGEETAPSRPFRWYAQPSLLLRSIGLQLLLHLWQLLTMLVCMAPGLLFLVVGSQAGSRLLATLSLPLLAAAPLASYWLYCLLLPAQYVMAHRCSLGPIQALRQGAALLRGRRKEFFFFRLSFVGWNLVSLWFNGLPDAFIFPYEETATLLFLNTLEGTGETAHI